MSAIFLLAAERSPSATASAGPVSHLGGEVCISAPQCLQSDLQQCLQHQKEHLLRAVGISMAWGIFHPEQFYFSSVEKKKKLSHL